MDEQRLTPAQVDHALAAIEKGHQLEGQQPSARALDRARRILSGELSAGEAEIEMQDAVNKIVERERNK
ncbi:MULTISPECIES: hypothetical protein [unclassified Microbacterium]|uniref:hypothetical protein n=1 Tax=unclassified Microbacterium TaxID=2609290 RepID=UPI00109C401E|nr:MULTISPECIES: hypothetical protein [unclassified Microbacterium]